ncbi:tetraacyldisaccharide 4'-kinase [Alistipes sp. OttesenSCG-928-B03]|nr:tetraacyldisaccharide 4'-kinase [Alistipes sp. OttesenSCG-928-B03]
MGKAWLAPLAFLYNIGISVRHKMFDWGLKRSRAFDIPIVCVGNLTVGGTGKTPVTEMLVRNLKRDWNVAVLSRGYKRKTKGYLEIDPRMSFLKTGDEAKQIKLKFPDVVVAVCEKRADGIDEIRRRHPEVNLIILDDAFQHRYVTPWVNILLMDHSRPIYNDHLLPWGTLRDKKSQIDRAGYVLVTKCPTDMNPLERRLVRKSLKLYPYQSLFFCSTVLGNAIEMFPDGAHVRLQKGDNVIAMSGIGNPAQFEENLSERYTVVGRLEYPDHHPYRSRDLKDMMEAINNSPKGTVIVTTEKDAVKLRGSRKIPAAIRERLFYIPVKVAFYEDTQLDFLKSLQHDLRTDPRDRLVHM